MLFWKQERKVQQDIEEYLRETEACVSTCGQAFTAFFDAGLSAAFEALVEKTHLHEHTADVKRREIERTMYDKALIPESRGDILGMLEALDLVPNKCESVLYQVWLQSMSLPDEFVEPFRRLVQANLDSYARLTQAMRDLFTKTGNVAPGADRVAEKEVESDVIERKLIKAIFDSDLDKADKILLKELVLEIGAISDRAENASDRLRNIAVKRQS